MNASLSSFSDPNITNTNMQPMGDAFGQMLVAQPAAFSMHAQPPVDLSTQFPTSPPQMPSPSLPPMQPVPQQQDQNAAVAATQLINSLQLLANAVSQAATQNR